MTSTYLDTANESWSLTPEQHEFLCKRAYDGVESFLKDIPMDKNRDGNPWIVEYEKKELDLTVYYSQPKNSSIRRFKAVCLIHDTTPQALMDFMCDSNHRLTWDRGLQNLTYLNIHEGGDLGRVVILRSATKPVGPISGRDFMDAVVIRTLADGSIIQCGTGVDSNDNCGLYPVSKDFIRGLNQICGSHIQSEPTVNGVKVSYIIETDLKGWFPSFVINSAIGGSYSAYFEDIRRALKEKNSS